jgi:hypothetical protein
MVTWKDYVRSSLGGTGNALALPGAMTQSASSFVSAASAQRAWSQVTRDLVKFRKNTKGPIPTNEEFQRTQTGVSPVAFTNGSQTPVPGPWSRKLWISDSGFSQKTYFLHPLVDNLIQTVTYNLGMKDRKQVPLDQDAVNALAVTLAQPWVAAAVPPK